MTQVRHISTAIRFGTACTLVGALSVLGCGGDAAPAPDPQSSATQSGAPSTPEQTSTAPPAVDPGDPKSKTKWVGGIPYDVFYDQPLVVASENTSSVPVIAAGPGTQPEPVPPADTSSSPPTTSDSSAGGAPDWQQLAAADVLNEEVKRLRNSLTTNLNTLATYNRNIDSIVNDGATLAALAAVVEVHPDRVSWTDNAKFVRDLGYEIYMKADGSGRGPFEATKLPFEQIVEILNGGPPPDLEATDKVPFSDVADRSEMMKRIKASFEYLKAEINTEARFKESPEDVTREASVLASMGGMISTDSYDSTDEEEYQKFVTNFIQACVDMSTAATTDDYSKFEDARSRVQNACNACHGEYAFGDEGF